MPGQKPILAIVGAGRVGCTLGRLLRRRGWRIGAVVTRSPQTARAGVRAIGAGRAQSRLDATVLAADILLIATPDRAIASVANDLARLAVAQGAPDEVRRAALRLVPRFVGRGFNRDIEAARAERLQPLAGRARQGRLELIILHTNGALDRSVLAPLEKLGAATGSLHPLQTFTRDSEPDLAGAICAIEGTPRAVRVARRIARDLGCTPVVIAAQAKPAYHAAAALAAGHTLAVAEAATRILIALGFTRRQAVRALLPLTRQTLANFDRLGANAAWTGPLARGDFATVKKHAAALRKFPRQYREAYDTLSRLALLVLGKGTRR